MNEPINIMIEKVLKPVTCPAGLKHEDGIPYVTHSGILELFGLKLKVHRLSNGQSVIEEDSMREVLKKIGSL